METTNPVGGTKVSASQWGSAVFHDLSALSNMAASGLMSIPNYTHAAATSYADIPGVSMAFEKELSTSKLLVFGTMSIWISGAINLGTSIGVKVDGNVYDAGYLFHNDIQVHLPLFFAVPIPGLTAGTKSITFMEKSNVSGGGQSVRFDSNDRCNCIVIEIP